MAETKSKKAADKFFDVAKPGKSAPSSTSRPVIITNRPVLKDPMVIRVDTGDDEAASSSTSDGSTEMKHKIDIKPLHIDLESVLAPSAPEVKKSTKKAAASKADDDKPAEAETPAPDDTSVDTETPNADAPEPSPEAKPEVPVEEETPTEPAEAAKPVEPVQRVREKVIAPPTSDTPESKPDDKSTKAETPAPDDTPADTADEPDTKPIEDSIGDDEPSLDNSDKPVLSEKETKAAEAAKQRAEEQEKIIASGQFYLPINAVSKRRTKRNIVIGTFFVVVLIVAAALAAWDAGLFSIPGFTAPTNFL